MGLFAETKRNSGMAGVAAEQDSALAFRRRGPGERYRNHKVALLIGWR
jgi:hypothetical protein